MSTFAPVDRFGRIRCATVETALGLAAGIAAESPCQSKRGVVIWRDGVMISRANNGQPRGFMCDGSEQCRKNCGKSAVHAEQRALLFALADQYDVYGASMLHVKVVDGEPVASERPSCIECSKLILEAGVCEMWLLHNHYYDVPERHTFARSRYGVLVRRSALEFHRSTTEDYHKFPLVQACRGDRNQCDRG